MTFSYVIKLHVIILFLEHRKLETAHVVFVKNTDACKFEHFLFWTPCTFTICFHPPTAPPWC